MLVKHGCQRSMGELDNRFERDEQVMAALVTAGAFVALSDGRVDPMERDETVDYIDRRRLAPSISRERLAEFFYRRVGRLQDRDFADLIAESFRPVARLSLAPDVIRIAERIAAVDGRIHPNEVQVIALMRLLLMSSSEKNGVAREPNE